MRPLRLPVLLALPALLLAQRVQSPSAPWRTITTTHYRIHFPAGEDFPAFAWDVASRIEGIHAQYLDLVGHVWAGPVDVVIQDPLQEPNGQAVAYPDRPFVILWRTPPEPDSPLGHPRSWPELLVTHELGHLHHLLLPQRGRSFMDWLLGLRTPVATKSPRWVVEGYATLLEGRLTGSGRPHGAFRAALLRTWAREGRLPTYAGLDAGDGFLGGNRAYLVGSAYLEWLEQQHRDRPAILRDLWRQLSGPRHRSFREAFTATFGQGPDVAYARFCAEVTHGALELERRVRAEGIREGTVFTQVPAWVGDLAVSPDGTRLLARVGDPRAPSLQVWDLQRPPRPQPAPPAGDPTDAPPAVPVVAAAWTLPRIHGSAPRGPRWTADGQAIAFTVRLPDREGVLRPTAWVWKPGASPRRVAAAPPLAPPPVAYDWAPDPDIWNLRRRDGATSTWLTRTLSAAWSPAPTPDGRSLYYAQLAGTGVQVRRLDLGLPPLPHGPLPVDPTAFAPGAILPRPEEPSPLPPPEAPPEAHAYRVAESLKTFPVAGGTVSPSESGLQLGLGFNDILGRLNGLLLLGEGSGPSARGALAGAAWRGTAWEPSLQVFQVRQRPSLQAHASAPAFDRDREGASFELRHEDLGLGTFRQHLRLFTERQASLDGGASRRRIGGELGLALSIRRSRGDWGLQAGVQDRMFLGHTEGQAWNGFQAAASLRFLAPWAPLTLRHETGSLGGHPTFADRFELGGLTSNLVPEAADLNRVPQVALPAFLASGDRFRRWRGELGLGVGHAYVDHVAVWEATTPRPSYLRVVGWELGSAELGLNPEVIQRLLGRLTFTLGLHRPLDGPTRHRTVGTLSISLRP
ncbi:MAG TPA: hypothetical protein VJ623_09180 [Holophagaceae bacterium]|nr:hypothetical protein [Holophagaceae bacterium]